MRRYRHLSFTDRLRIDANIRAGKKPKEVAEILGVHISTIYRELKRGQYEHLNSDYTTETRYSPDIADEKYRENLKAKGAPMKIGSDYKLADYIESKILNEKYSPGAVLGEIKANGISFSVTISKSTLYSYIDKGVFLQLTNKDLPEKSKKRRPYKHVRGTRPPRGESIEKRPAEVDDRNTFGHWEMDTVISAARSKKTLLVLTERLTRREIIEPIRDRTTASVVAALDRLERQYGKLFPRIFKTITCDNGTEFSDCEGIERKRRGKGKRTKVYYCHPYSSYERGSNEVQNRMIRRHLPKGTDFAQVPDKEIRQIEKWMNNYPREILGFQTAETLFKSHLDLIEACG